MTEKEIVEHLGSLDALPFNLKYKVGTGWRGKKWISVYAKLDYSPLLYDRSNLENIKTRYIMDRFDGYTIPDDITEKKLETAAKRIRRRVEEVSRDFETTMDFIDKELDFPWDKMTITVRGAGFSIGRVKAYISWRTTKEGIVIVHNQNTNYTYMNQDFLNWVKTVKEEVKENLNQKELINN